jgi:hypothetical protein
MLSQKSSISKGPESTPTVSSSANCFLQGLLLFVFVFFFWMLFSTFFESFCRDDNAGGTAPVLVDMARQLLAGRLPNHVQYLGGGGGAWIPLSMSGLFDPLVAVPALLLWNHPELLFNFIGSLHLAMFAVGGYFLAFSMGAPRWTGIIAGLSLGFSGYFFVWAGNWMFFLIPYACLPWLIAGIIGISQAQSLRGLLVHEVISAAAVLGIFSTGSPFPPYYSGIVSFFVVASILVGNPKGTRQFVVRLLPQIMLFLLAVIPALLSQKRLFDFYGGRTPMAEDWLNMSVPIKAYMGLFIPISYSHWNIDWFEGPVLASNLLLSCGVVPAWYILLAIFRKPRLFIDARHVPLVLGIVVLAVVMSPNSFGLIHFFADTPILNVFRWPFRAIPAFHVLIVLLFMSLAAELDPSPARLRQIVVVLVCVGCSLIAVGHELSLMKVRDSGMSWYEELAAATKMSPVVSWYHMTPRLDDSETWDRKDFEALKNAGYVVNVCRSEIPFHRKPRLFFYGNLGAEFGVRTVHLYVVPFPVAYSKLGMTSKGCITDWQGVKELIENGPQKPLPQGVAWNVFMGPKSFEEITEKTYVGAAIVDTSYSEPMQYFLASPHWRLAAKKDSAALFLRDTNPRSKP